MNSQSWRCHCQWGLWLCVSVCVSALLNDNGLSYQHQPWYTYALWQDFTLTRRSKIKGQGYTDRKTVTILWLVRYAAAAGVGLHILWLLRFLVVLYFPLWVSFILGSGIGGLLILLAGLNHNMIIVLILNSVPSSFWHLCALATLMFHYKFSSMLLTEYSGNTYSVNNGIQLDDNATLWSLKYAATSWSIYY